MLPDDDMTLGFSFSAESLGLSEDGKTLRTSVSVGKVTHDGEVVKPGVTYILSGRCRGPRNRAETRG